MAIEEKTEDATERGYKPVLPQVEGYVPVIGLDDTVTYHKVTGPENYPDEPSLVRTLKKGFNAVGIEANTDEEVLLVLQGVTLGLVIACFIAARTRR